MCLNSFTLFALTFNIYGFIILIGFDFIFVPSAILTLIGFALSNTAKKFDGLVAADMID